MKTEKEIEIIGIWHEYDEDGWGDKKIKISEAFQIYLPTHILNKLRNMGMRDKSKIRIRMKVLK